MEGFYIIFLHCFSRINPLNNPGNFFFALHNFFFIIVNTSKYFTELLINKFEFELSHPIYRASKYSGVQLTCANLVFIY